MNSKQVGYGIISVIVKIVIAIVVIMLLYHYAGMAYTYGYQVFNQTPVNINSTRTVTVVVNDGDSVTDVANTLENQGLINDVKLFKLQERFSNYHGMIAPGSYELSASMTPEQMLEIMAGQSETDETEITGNSEYSESENYTDSGDTDPVEGTGDYSNIAESIE